MRQCCNILYNRTSLKICQKMLRSFHQTVPRKSNFKIQSIQGGAPILSVVAKKRSCYFLKRKWIKWFYRNKKPSPRIFYLLSHICQGTLDEVTYINSQYISCLSLLGAIQSCSQRSNIRNLFLLYMRLFSWKYITAPQVFSFILYISLLFRCNCVLYHQRISLATVHVPKLVFNGSYINYFCKHFSTMNRSSLGFDMSEKYPS